MQKIFDLSAVETSDPIDVAPDEVLTFSVSGAGTVQAEVQLTRGDRTVSPVWKVVQVCADGEVYSTETGIRRFRFNQTNAVGSTICEVTSGKN